MRRCPYLEAGAVVGELANTIKSQVDDLLADGVFATSEVVRGIFLARDQLQCHGIEIHIIMRGTWLVTGVIHRRIRSRGPCELPPLSRTKYSRRPSFLATSKHPLRLPARDFIAPYACILLAGIVCRVLSQCTLYGESSASQSKVRCLCASV